MMVEQRLLRSHDLLSWPPFPSGPMIGTHPLRGDCPEFRQPQEIVRGRDEVGLQTDSRRAAIASLSYAADGLPPAEDLLDPFTEPLAAGVAEVPRGAPIDHRPAAGVDVLRYMRRYAQGTQPVHEPAHVVAFVGAEGPDGVPRGALAAHHAQGFLPLGLPVAAAKLTSTPSPWRFSIRT